jgi:acyl-CoA thioesterase I
MMVQGLRARGWPTRLNSVGCYLGLLWVVCNLVGGVAMAAGPPAGQKIKIVAFGDSLTAGFGVKPADAFPVQLEAALKARGHDVEIINAGVSGDTSSAGLDRFEWAVGEGVDAAIVELGANDALRGLDPAATRAALGTILEKLSARRIEVLLAGMKAPRNWGEAYAVSFDAIYPDLARAKGALLYPFFLEGVVLDQALNQGDGIHPNAAGVAVIVQRILPDVERLIARVKAKAASPGKS